MVSENPRKRGSIPAGKTYVVVGEAQGKIELIIRLGLPADIFADLLREQSRSQRSVPEIVESLIKEWSGRMES